MRTGQTLRRWLGVAVILAAVLAAWPSQVGAAPPRQAQGGEMLFLSVMDGTLNSAAPDVSYTFDANQGFPFSLFAWTRSGSLMTTLTVLDPGGKTLAEAQPIGEQDSVSVVNAAFAPQDGTYTVVLRRVGDTSGEYGLLLSPGYDYLDKYDDFSSADPDLNLTWDSSSTQSTASKVINGQLRMQITAPDTVGYLPPTDDVSWSDLYMEADVTVEGTPSYAEYGFLLRLDTAVDTFYALTFSTDNDWTLLYYHDGWNEIQPWTQSPVIDGTDSNPRIAVYVRGSTFRAYFNDQFVGEVTDPNQSLAEGTIALASATNADQDDPLTVYFDNLVITSPGGLVEPQGPGSGDLSGALATATAMASGAPTPASGVPYLATRTPAGAAPTAAFVMPTNPPLPTTAPLPTQVPATPPPSSGGELSSWAGGRPEEITVELAQQGIIPAGGALALTIPTSFGDTSASGFNFYPLGRGQIFRNFVLGFDAHLDITGPGSGCGMHFRANSTSSSSALVTEDGSALLAQFNNGTTHAATVFTASPAVQPGQGAVNRVIVVANEAEMRLYVNGQPVAQGTFTAQEGTIALELFVAQDAAGATQRTYCQLDNIWLWTFQGE